MTKKNLIILATITVLLLLFIASSIFVKPLQTKSSTIVEIGDFNLAMQEQSSINANVNTQLIKNMQDISAVVIKQQELEARITSLENTPVQRIITQQPAQNIVTPPTVAVDTLYTEGKSFLLSNKYILNTKIVAFETYIKIGGVNSWEYKNGAWHCARMKVSFTDLKAFREYVLSIA